MERNKFLRFLAGALCILAFAAVVLGCGYVISAFLRPYEMPAEPTTEATTEATEDITEGTTEATTEATTEKTEATILGIT